MQHYATLWDIGQTRGKTVEKIAEKITRVLQQIEKANPGESDLYVSLDDLMEVIKSNDLQINVRYH